MIEDQHHIEPSRYVSLPYLDVAVDILQGGHQLLQQCCRGASWWFGPCVHDQGTGHIEEN